MNRKDPEEVVNKNKTIRFTKKEVEIVEQKAKNAGMSFSAYCREIAARPIFGQFALTRCRGVSF